MRRTLFGSWVAALDDAAFACVVAAVGVLHDMKARAGWPRIADYLREGDLTGALEWIAGEDTLVPWHDPGSGISFWMGTVPEAAKLADAWVAFRATRHPGLRLVLDASTTASPPNGIGGEGLPALMEILANPVARIDAVFTAWQADRDAAWNWPVRLGLQDDQPSLAIGASIGRLYPSNALARVFAFSRRESHCDIAILSGSPRTCLARMLSSRFGERAGLLLFTGGLKGATSHEFTMLEMAAREMRASGFAATVNSLRDPDVFVNQVITHLSHNMPLDVALFVAAQKANTGPPILFLDPEFAERTQLSAVSHAMGRNLERAGETPVELPPGLSGRIGVHASAKISARAAGQALKSRTSDFRFAGESHEATDIAEAKPVLEAMLGTVNTKRRDPRYIQAQVQRVGNEGTEPAKTLLVGELCYVNVRIGPFDEEWINPINHTPFPDELLPVDDEEHRLRVILSEPNHLPEPLVKSVTMKRTGASSIAQFEIVPRPSQPSFRARITVAHRNRVLQTAVLSAGVLAAGETPKLSDEVTVQVEAVVRPLLQDLAGRSRFDVAIEFNHTPEGQPSMLALAENSAVLRDMSAIKGKINAISERLSKVAPEAKRYAKGLEGEEGLDLLRFLADKGVSLHRYLVEDQADTALGERLRKADYVQIVSLSPDAYFPAEFIYEFDVPAPDAKVCPAALEALKTDNYSRVCTAEDHKSSGPYSKYVCPFGFWGLRRVIERHAWRVVKDSPAGDYVLQAEPSTSRRILEVGNATIVAASSEVDKEQPGAVQALFESLRRIFKTPVERAATWEDWWTLVHNPGPPKGSLIALPHVEGRTESGDTEYFLEIGGNMLKAAAIRKDSVLQAEDAPAPLVILLGCNTSVPQSAIDSIVGCFRRAGAGIVVGTVASVLGSHASAVAQEIATQIVGLSKGKEVPFGDLLLAVRRRALGRGIVMAMCVGGFGDADWLVKT